MQSDQDLGKKLLEEGELLQFAEAYKYVTGEELIWLPFSSRRENPDFILYRGDGSPVLVELTQVGEEPQDIHDAIFGVLEKKNWDPDWKSKIILVIQFKDYPMNSVIHTLDDELATEFSYYGWLEVWLCDYTVVEPFGCVDLFGLVPKKWWGYHQGPRQSWKPYG